MPQTLAELLQHAEHVVDDLNNNKQAMVVRSVHKMKAKAQACVAVGGGVFEGRRVNCNVYPSANVLQIVIRNE